MLASEFITHTVAFNEKLLYSLELERGQGHLFGLCFYTIIIHICIFVYLHAYKHRSLSAALVAATISNKSEGHKICQYINKYFPF